MNLKIRPYLKTLIKQNFAYILLIAAVVILSAILPSIMINKLTENQSKRNQLKKEISELQARKNLLLSAEGKKTDLQQSVKLLNSLVPDIENYFSIITALEEISRKTNVSITSYDIPFQNTNEIVNIKVGAIGDEDTFINFLNTYEFGGGRLATVDKIDFNSQSGKSFDLSLNFYSKDVKSIPPQNDYRKTLELVKILKSKAVAITIKEDLPTQEIINPNSQISGSYPTKSNPF